MVAIWISAIFLALVRNAAAAYNPAVCSIFEENFGLIPPPLPKNFEMKAEHVDHMKNFTMYEEMYFDYSNSRAKYKYLLDTFEFHYLFDYKTEQVVEWTRVHPGVTGERDPISHEACKAIDMKDSKYSYMFGYQDPNSKRYRIFNSNEVLRYGDRYLYTANGTELLADRGLQTNIFASCLYDASINATMATDYYFIDTGKAEPSGGTPSSIVTGSDERPLSVPAKLHIKGGRNVGDSVQVFNKTLSVSWFKGNPVFQPSTFQIPPYTHCKNYRGSKEIPKLPRAFSTRITNTGYQIDMLGQLQPESSTESYEEIYYDQDRNLARRDFTPNKYTDRDIFVEFGNYEPVSTIYDFNEGFRFMINKHSGRCSISPIGENEYFDTEENLLFRKLGTPEEIFMMQMEDMEYKGESIARDITSDVWSGKHFHVNYNARFVKETYFSKDKDPIPVRNVLIKQDLDGDMLEGIGIHDFLKFTKTQPSLTSFDIKGCVEHVNHKRFAILLNLSELEQEQVYKYRSSFLDAAQLYIANRTEVKSPLRVQRLHFRQQSVTDSRVFLVFSLLGKAKDLPAVVTQPGKNLKDAIVLLQQLIGSGNFSVQFENPDGQVMAVTAGKSSLYTLTAGGKFTSQPFKLIEFRDSEKEEDTIIEEKEGMTGGHLALLSFAMLFIGVGIGIAIMYFYQKRYSGRYVENALHLEARPDSS